MNANRVSAGAMAVGMLDALLKLGDLPKCHYAQVQKILLLWDTPEEPASYLRTPQQEQELSIMKSRGEI